MWRESVFSRAGRRFPRRSSGIGDELAVLVVNRDHHAVVHNAFAGVMGHAEDIDCCFAEATILQVGVPGVKVLEGELERRVDLPIWYLCRLLWRCDILNWS